MKILFFILIIIGNLSVYSQQDMYLVTYKMDTYGLKDNDTKIYEDDRISSVIKKINKVKKDIEFELYFNRYSSSFRLKEKIIPEGEDLFYTLAALPGARPGVIYYKNTKKKIKIKQTESMGEIFRIDFPFQQYDWKITNEIKIINGFTCYKASTNWEEYSYSRNITLKFEPVVWFTNDIPFPFGPRGLDGLPGLVLEGTFNGKTYFYVTQIRNDVKDKRKMLDEPKKGKRITHDDFLKLLGTVKIRQN